MGVYCRGLENWNGVILYLIIIRDHQNSIGNYLGPIVRRLGAWLEGAGKVFTKCQGLGPWILQGIGRRGYETMQNK